MTSRVDKPSAVNRSYKALMSADKQTQEAQEQNPRKMARGKQSQHPAENSASQADEGQPALKRRKKEKADRPKAAAAPAPSEKPAASVQAPQKAGREAKKWPSPARKPDEKRAGTKRYSGATSAALYMLSHGLLCGSPAKLLQ